MHRDFARDFDALTELYRFAEDIFAANEISEAVRFPVHLALEELFTNMVKYSPDADGDIRVDVVVAGGAVTVTLAEDNVDEFDVTQPRNVDTGAPLSERTPGGLGLFLLQNLVDRLEYSYQDRRSSVVFSKNSG